MPLDHSGIGVRGDPQERSWTSADALLYAVGVGAGLDDPLRELEFTTENCEGVRQQVLPTYAILIVQGRPDAARVTLTGPGWCTRSSSSSCTGRCPCRAPSGPPRR